MQAYYGSNNHRNLFPQRFASVRYFLHWWGASVSLFHIVECVWKLTHLPNFLPCSLAKSLGDIVSIGLFCQLLVCAVCLAIYMIAFMSNHVIDVTFFVSIVGSTTIVASTYIYCYFSETVTRNLQMIGDIFYESPWYRLPLVQQQIFILPINRGQAKYRMAGLKLVECSLSTFSSVWNLLFGCGFWNELPVHAQYCIFNGYFSVF